MGDRTCAVEGCERDHYAKGWCNTHWRRWRETGDPGSAQIQPYRAGPVCQFTGCSKTRKGNGRYCSMHAARAARGHPMDSPPRQTITKAGPCLVVDCNRPRGARGWCTRHYHAWKMYGDPQLIAKPGYAHPKGSKNPKWAGDDVTYSTLHQRLRRYRGSPTKCGHCGVTGRHQWALDWDKDPKVRYEDVKRRGKVDRLPYSSNLQDYIALCRSCHRRFDLARQ